MTQPSDRARKAAEQQAWFVRHADYRHPDSYVNRDPAYFASECAAAFNNGTLATFERETPGFAAGVEAEEIERDIRIALWNTGCWQGKPQEVAQSFIRHAMEEPCMIRALTAIRALTPAPPADLCADIAQKSADAIKE